MNLKQVVNKNLKDPRLTKEQREILCAVIDEVIAGWKTGYHCFCSLDPNDTTKREYY
jgi:hypothetical protein